MKVLGLLTGRGNNTLENKNLLQVRGHPLLSYPARIASSIKEITHLAASSDDLMILDEAQKYDFEKIVRPSELAQNNSPHIDAILHSLDYLKNKGMEFDIVCVFLANTVTLKRSWVRECINILSNNNDASAVCPVRVDQDHHPYRAKRRNSEGYLESFFDFNGESISTNRQDLIEGLFLAHNFWVIKVSSIYDNNGRAPWTFMGDKVIPYVIDEAFDVHSLRDIALSEMWLKKNDDYDK